MGKKCSKKFKKKIMEKYTVNIEDSLLLVIDVQDRLFKALYQRDEVVSNIKRLLEASKILKIPSIFTVQNPDKLGGVSEELLDKIDNPPILSKMAFTAYNEELEEKLSSLAKKNIIMVGGETHVCVLQTTRDLLLNGYNVSVVSDAVASRAVENKKTGLRFLKGMGATITSTEIVLFDLLKTSSHSDFKSVQALIK